MTLVVERPAKAAWSRGTHSDVLTGCRVAGLFLQLTAAKVSKSNFRQNSVNSLDISKAFFEMGIWKFESSQVEFAARSVRISAAVAGKSGIPSLHWAPRAKRRGWWPYVRLSRSPSMAGRSIATPIEVELVNDTGSDRLMLLPEKEEQRVGCGSENMRDGARIAPARLPKAI
jgi:hypothetical protein